MKHTSTKIQKMEGKRSKRGKGKTTGSHGRVNEKKKKTHVINAKEEMDRLEAASVLSSLMFLPPKSSDSPEDNSPTNSEPNGVVTTTSTVTYISTPPSTGIPTRGSQGPQSMARGSGTQKTAITSALGGAPKQPVNAQLNNLILAHLQNQLNSIVRNGQSHQQLQLVMPAPMLAMQKAKQAAPAKVTAVPNTVRHAETTKLPMTLNMGQTINREVASALRQAVTSTNKKQIVNDSAQSKNIPYSSVQFKPQKEKHTDIGETLQSPINSGILLSSSVVDSESTNRIKNKDNSDNKLPLKKRRLVPVGEASSHDVCDLDSKVDQKFIQGISSPRLSDLTSAAQIENILQMAREYTEKKGQSTAVSSVISYSNDTKTQDQGEGYRPVQIDPRTSLMILSDVKVALTPDQDGDLPIHIAVVHENIELVRKCIDIMAMSGKSVDRYNKLQQTPLHLAILVNKPDIVTALLSAGANPNLVDRHGCTALHIAVKKQFPECLQTVFEYTEVDLRLNTKNYDGYPPLHTCVDLDDLTTLQYLIHHGASVDAQDGKAGRSTLFYATEYNRVKMVDLLISENANADMQNYAGVTPLMVAQSGSMTEMIQILQRALDILKASDDPQDNQIKKVQIPRIPSKSSLIVPGLRSRSNSEDGQSPGMRGRTPSVSSCPSPIDLSINRNTESPKDLSRARLDRGFAVSNVKEKHTQLVAALEGRNVMDKNIVNSSSVEVIKPAFEPAITLLGNYFTTMTPEQGSVMIKKEREDDSLEVTSSSDVSMEITCGNKVISEGIKSESDMQTEVSEDMVLSSEESVKMKTEKKYGTDGVQEKQIDTSPCVTATSAGKPTMSKTLESEALESVDTDLSDGNSLYTDQSPEMPVLSRMVSLSNEQDCSSVLVADDILEIDEEDMPNAMLENQSENGTKSPVVLENQKSQESLGSQGFETVHNRKSVEIEMEVDVSSQVTQKSEHSDDSVEIDNSALCKVSSMVSGQKVAKESNDSDGKQMADSVEPENMETDEEDEDKPLVIDESPMETSVDNRGVKNKDIRNKRSKFGVLISRSRTEETFPISKENEKEDKDRCASKNIDKVQDDSVKDGLSFRVNEKTKTDDKISANGKASYVQIESQFRPVLKNGSLLDAPSVRTGSVDNKTKDHSIMQQSSSKLTLNSLKATADVVENISQKSKVFSQDESEQSSTSSETIFGESEKKATSEPSKQSGIDSVDNILKDGKAHTLFYHDGESYKPIRIFIDNSEQSSLVLQKMLQASFANKQSNQEAQSNSTNSSGELSGVSKIEPSTSDLTVSEDNSLKGVNKTYTEKMVSAKTLLSNGVLDSDRAKVSSSIKIDKNLVETHTKHLPSANLPHVNATCVTDKLSLNATCVTDKLSLGPASSVEQTTTVKPKATAKSNKPSFQMAYIDSLKKTAQLETERSKRVKTTSIQSVSDKTVSSSSETKMESFSNKRQKVSNGKGTDDSAAVADQASRNRTSLSNSEVHSASKTGDTKAKSGDTKIVEVNTAEKIIKLHISPEVLPAMPTHISSEVTAATLRTSSVSQLSESLPISGQNTRKFIAPRVMGTTSTTILPGRTSVSEGTLTRINPDIKNKLSMALLASQRRLGKPKPENGQEYPNVQDLISSPSVTAYDSVTAKSVSDSRQQL